jgi:integrase
MLLSAYPMLTRCLPDAYPMLTQPTLDEARNRRAAQMKLTERLVSGLKPSTRDMVVWDDVLPGFAVRVKPSGVKSYLIQYRNADHVSKRYTLGKASELRLENARKRAAALLAEVKDERNPADPAADRKVRRRADSIRDLCERYLSDHAEVHAKPSYLKQQRRMIETQGKPALGGKPIRAVTRADVQALHLKLRQTPYEANRVLALLSVLFRVAEHWKLRDDGTNPCHGVKRYREKRRERLLTDAEVAHIYAGLAEAERTRTLPEGVIIAVRLLFATTCRAGEILGLRWDYIDRDRREVVWPDSKTGHMRKPLTDEIAALLDRVERVLGNPYVCVNASRTGPLSLHTLEAAWRRLLKSAGVAHCGLHAIRHRAATDVANNADIPLHVGMAITGHRTAATYLRYLHSHKEQVRDAAERASAHRLGIIGRKLPDVTPLRQRH